MPSKKETIKIARVRVLDWTRERNDPNGNPIYSFEVQDCESESIYIGRTKAGCGFVYGLYSSPNDLTNVTIERMPGGRVYMTDADRA